MAVLKKSRRSNSNSFSEDNDAIGQRISIQQSSVDSKNIHMNRILCQAYSVDSNISDLSGSIGPNNRPRRANNRTQSSDADENIFMSILNDCAALTGISELVSDSQAAITGEATDDKKGKKSKRSSRSKSSQPNIWGVSPSNQEDFSDSDDAKPTKSNKKYEENLHHDNIELVLDDNFVPTPDTVKSPSKKHLQLKKKVASALNRSSPHLTSSSPPDVAQANRNDVPATSKDMNEGYGPSLLDEIGDDGLGNGGVTSKPISQAKTASSAVGYGRPGSMNSGGKKKSSRKFFGFSSKKKGLAFSGKSKRASREQIEEAKKWKSTPDKASGKTYYYNSDTNETKWTKPVGYDEAHEELALAAESQEGGASNHWKATLDASTGKTYYYNKKTKEVSWTIPKGFKGSVRAEKNSKRTVGGGGKDIGGKSEVDDAKYWRETVDKTTGKKYYFNKKTKMVSWEKPAGFGTTMSTKKDNKISEGETAPLARSRSAPVSENRVTAEADDNTPFDEEPPDAPFDEPDGVPASPRRAHFDNKNIANAVPLNGRSKSLKSIEFTKQRTYASAMTDTTTKVANTGKPRRDFNSTKINVINDSDEESSKDAAPIASPKRGSQPKQDNATTPSRGTTSQNVGKTPIVSPSSPKRRYRTKKAENLGSDEDSDMDDWSDEVSELSGIGNDEGAKGSRSKHQKDSRTESSTRRDSPAVDSPGKSDDPKNWSKEQLDSFISKNDWGQVAKYIAESRKTTNGAPTQKQVGRMAKMQEESASQVSQDDDSVWQSLSEASNGKGASFDYDKVAARQPTPTVQ